MKFRNILISILLITVIILAARIISVLNRNISYPRELKNEYEQTRRRISNEFKTKEKELLIKHEYNKYLASGTTAYDRIFNKKDQTILQLIDNIASEALPGNWKHEVKAEEFTHFILLVYPPDKNEYNISELSTAILPIVEYCGDYLKNIAFYNQKRKCYMFFDDEILSIVTEKLQDIFTVEQKSKELGNSFTRFNSFTINCERLEGHLIVPITVSSSSDALMCYALLDTGASITMLSEDLVLGTVSGEYEYSTGRTFHTANGTIQMQVVNREIGLGVFKNNIEIAINEKDESNILGLNFFNGYHYMIDFSNACIYMWE